MGNSTDDLNELDRVELKNLAGKLQTQLHLEIVSLPYDHPINAGFHRIFSLLLEVGEGEFGDGKPPSLSAILPKPRELVESREIRPLPVVPETSAQIA